MEIIVIVLVAEQYVYIVLAELPVVGKQLVEGVAEKTLGFLTQISVHSRAVAEIWIIIGCGFAVGIVETEVCAKLESLERTFGKASQLCVGPCAQVICKYLVFVFIEVGYRIPAG